MYDQQSFKTMTNCQTQRGEGTKKNDFLHISGFLFLCEILSRNTFESCSCSWAGGRRTQPALSQKVNKSIINSVLIILWSSSQTAAVQNTSRLPCAWLLSNSVKHYICVNVCHRFGHALSFNVFWMFLGNLQRELKVRVAKRQPQNFNDLQRICIEDKTPDM